MTRTEIVTIARSYIGTPFHHQGRVKGVGIDCVGLLVCVMRECGLTVEDKADYNGLIDSALLRSKLDTHLVQHCNASLQPGDILLLRIGKHPQHIAIVTDTGIIHTHQGSGKVVETSLGKWANCIVAAYRLPGVAI
jgi:cell wall-associated NlpC family hydrolase